MTERRKTNPEIHLRNVEAGEAAETAPAREGEEEEEGERGTSSGPAAVTPGPTISAAAAGGGGAAAAETEALAEVGAVTGQWSRALVGLDDE